MEVDFNREGFFEADSPQQADIIEQSDSLKQGTNQFLRPGPREQMELLGLSMNAGAPQFINPSLFPDVPWDTLAASRMIAFDNETDRQQAARFLVDENVGRMMANQITHRIKSYQQNLQRGLVNSSEEPDYALLRKQMTVRQSGDANGTMGEVISRGLVEEFNNHNFPALRGMDPVSHYRLLMMVVSNRIKGLKAEQDHVPNTMGHGLNERSLTKDILDEDIKHWRNIYQELIYKYSNARKQANWQVPDLI